MTSLEVVRAPDGTRSPATDEGTRARLGDLFGRQGVGDRIRFQEPDQRQNPAAAFYSAIDVLLDTYPVNGATELCEAMWRGVPAISIRGDRRVGRIGSAILQITKLRAPCNNLLPYGDGIHKAVYDAEVKAGNHASPRWGLGGFYASVIQPGMVRPGDAILLLEEFA